MQTRAEQLAAVAKALKKRFPGAKVITNADCNPATPMTVRLEWANGRISKAVRADSPSQTGPDFLRKVLAILEPFQENNVPTKYQTVTA